MAEAKLPETRILIGSRAPSLAQTPTWTAFGDPDDHLRLTVLIASHIGAQTSAREARDATEACMAPAATWSARLDALAYLLNQWAPSNGAPCAALFDIDALDPGPLRAETLWDDRSFLRQRRQFLDAILAAVRRGGWVLVRPRPASSLSIELDQIAESDEPDTSPSDPLDPPPVEGADPALEALLDSLSPECRPLLAWLVKSEILSVREIERLLEAGGPEGFEEDLLDVVYDALPPSAQDAAKRLSSVRRPQTMNGSLGPFLLAPPTHETPAAASGELRLSREAIQILRSSSVLQPFTGSSMRMPRAVREQLRALAARSIPDEVTTLHRRLGSAPLEPQPLEERLETHFHAVQGGELADALRTACHYASDLRELAFRWSHEQRFDDAAKVYQAIVEQYDREDSYAWEYLGYNLALTCGEEEPSAERAAAILNAYRRAFELDRKNPLYHGRLLGFRAFLGEDVEMEFHRGMKRYLTDYGEQTEAISFFAEPVLRGMQRGAWGRHRFRVIARWRPILRRFARLGSLLGHEDGT